MSERLRVKLERSSRGKLWVRVFTGREGRLISFKELHEIVRGIIRCEREKYAGRVDDPAAMVRRFLMRACDERVEWSQIERDFMLTPEDRRRARARDDAAPGHVTTPRPMREVAPAPISCTNCGQHAAVHHEARERLCDTCFRSIYPDEAANA